jgi:hypothetical protein
VFECPDGKRNRIKSVLFCQIIIAHQSIKAMDLGV